MDWAAELWRRTEQSSKKTGRFLISMAGSIFDPAKSRIKTKTDGKKERKRGGKEERKKREGEEERREDVSLSSLS